MILQNGFRVFFTLESILLFKDHQNVAYFISNVLEQAFFNTLPFPSFLAAYFIFFTRKLITATLLSHCLPSSTTSEGTTGLLHVLVKTVTITFQDYFFWQLYWVCVARFCSRGGGIQGDFSEKLIEASALSNGNSFSHKLHSSVNRNSSNQTEKKVAVFMMGRRLESRPIIST